MRFRTIALLPLLFACAHPILPPQPPLDPRERQRAEAAACTKGTYPAWIDDSAVNAAIDFDHREALASRTNDSFHGATFSAQPPPLPRPDSRTSALLEERDAFLQACQASKKRPSAVSPSP